MNAITEQLINHWHANKIVVVGGNTEADIEDFESRYKVILPSDMRDYFLHVDGMSQYFPNSQDKQGFSFWSLHNVKTVLEETSKLVGLSYDSFEIGSLFIFADYLDWSWAYAIRLSANGLAETPVFLIGKEIPIKVADSFSEFVHLYLADAPELYGGSEPRS
jgi:hypothetical protein